MNRGIEDVVDRCLDLMREGRTVEQCLLLYPEFAADIEPLLRVAHDLADLPKAEPSAAAVDAAVAAAGAALSRKQESRRFGRPADASPPKRPRAKVIAFRLAAAAAAVLVLTVGLGTASARSLPGDLLYPLKLVTERVSFALTSSPDRRAELRLSFADSRLEELVRTTQADGRIDPALLKRLLNEATLALEAAKPAPEDRFRELVTQIDAFNTYQKHVFEGLKPVVQEDDSQLLSRAISVCDERGRWMRSRWEGGREEVAAPASEGTATPGPSQSPEQDRTWDSGCCRD
jgi:hypothetical protein